MYERLFSRLIVLILLLFPLSAFGGNIDPLNRFAWGENVGWINFGPSRGPGVTVTSSAITGYAWGKNIGWINLVPVLSGVKNDGEGNLSGYAWGENVGWISFQGVKINPSTGAFNGYAWGENIGWINFAPNGKPVTTSWRAGGTATTGALDSGFWQNKNGQTDIGSGATTGGVCDLTTWLRQYAPFQDLQLTATCPQVTTYVTNVMKATKAGGSSMNAMLKAKMLATSLDVYYSDPALGGNRITAPAPIGGVSIDLMNMCKMTDGTGGTATCSGAYENVTSAFGGAASLTISQMLSYAAGQSNAGGSLWYGNGKATQELAKDAFEAINNRAAFAP